MSDMYIQISNLFKSFGGQEILHGISFTVSGNDRIGFLGKNGAGKSTLFKIITGEEEGDNGSVVVSPKDARVAYLPQIINDPELENLSSGQKVKRYLEKLLKDNSQALLLDEPTNHLDWEGLDWLENIVLNFNGPIFVTSHDRWFLDKTVNKILELEDGRIKIYGGNYSFYKNQKLTEQEANLRNYIEQEKRINRLNERARVMKNRTQQLEFRTNGSDYYVRKKAAKAAKAALSIEKKIAKELAETKIEKPKPILELRAIFKPDSEGGQTVVQFKSVTKSFKKHIVFRDLSIVIEKKQRIALIGSNGSGKTTFIKLILDELSPDTGEVKLVSNINIGYLSQNHQELSNDQSVINELSTGKIAETESYKLLHRFLLTPEKINQPVKFLSSGEKSKLLLAKIMTKGANFIILDEPTNHLDIPSREAIEEAISSYEGTLLIVSHDRYFLDKVGINRIFYIEDYKIKEQ